MKQVQHSEKLVTLLAASSSNELDGGNDDTDEIASDLLKAQLSHSDGIRGFFVTYLTALGEDTPADRVNVSTGFVSSPFSYQYGRRRPLRRHFGLAVARGDNNNVMDDGGLIKYWAEFFEKWGYKDLQKRDIEQAIRSVLISSK
jgi:hypothetical protein